MHKILWLLGGKPPKPRKKGQKGPFLGFVYYDKENGPNSKMGHFGGSRGGSRGAPPGGPPGGKFSRGAPRPGGPPGGVQGGSPARALRGVDQPVRGCVTVGAMIND